MIAEAPMNPNAKRAAKWFVPFLAWCCCAGAACSTAVEAWNSGPDSSYATGEQVKGLFFGLVFLGIAAVGFGIWKRFRPPMLWLIGYLVGLGLLLIPAVVFIVSAALGGIRG
jgi:hypothetical protein